MKLLLYFTCFLLFVCSQANTQITIEREVSASGSSTYIGNNLALTATIGQSAVGTLQADGQFLTQGFQQPSLEELGTGVIDLNSQFTFGLYPNPAVENLQFVYSSPDYPRLRITMLDYLGRVILSDKYASSDRIENLDVSDIPSGYYTLLLSTEDKTVVISQAVIIQNQ